jgi:sulfite exporter TauE/SafE
LLADCLHGLTALAPAGGLLPLLLAMFATGLAGGATHCAGMCAPFVLAQVAAAPEGRGGPVLARLAGAALLPYHLGRMAGYGALGALAGGLGGALHGLAGHGILAALLGAAAVLMLVQGVARLRWLPAPRLPAALQRIAQSWLDAPTGWRGAGLGLLLSALPCGLLYAALVGAAAAGSAAAGALAMAAFVAGTVPALVGVGLLGRLFGRRFGTALRPAGTALFLLNAALLGGMAVKAAVA